MEGEKVSWLEFKHPNSINLTGYSHIVHAWKENLVQLAWVTCVAHIISPHII